jgi:hypothetical protein
MVPLFNILCYARYLLFRATGPSCVGAFCVWETHGKERILTIFRHLLLTACVWGWGKGEIIIFFSDFVANSVMGLFTDFGGTHNRRFLVTFEESSNTPSETSV